ncbi:hypothetical protein KGM_206357 [Danaus plexippus plexippus]|uniref:Uncharacterized protein n=1 Tax=Danaus plexippus plexippus TaxID=278856 RepID=A0A212EP90_DANPL|nr:hypothetical protein KGM_206357 [Danaus plexippus plexippus]
MSSQECATPCKCHYVQQWIDDHAKYFGHPASKPEQPPLVTRIADLTFPQTNFNDASQIQNHFMFVQPPYKISPVVPPLPPIRKTHT